MECTVAQAAGLLLSWDNVLILTHKNPDGDTLGAGFALYYALTALGKAARVANSDPVPEKYAYMTEPYFSKGYTAGVATITDAAKQAAGENGARNAFVPVHIVAVDVADKQLFGAALAPYADRVELCIDHHPTNARYAEKTLVDASAAAACEILAELIAAMGVSVSGRLADCIYTGLSTDTGCFQYTNTTAKTHRVAAALIDAGARHGMIDRLMFSSKSKAQLALEREALNTMEFYFNDRCAVVTVPYALQAGVKDDPGALDGISSLSRQVSGVLAGITLRQQADGGWKVSLRTTEPVDACEICAAFGGGGHKRAAGCVLYQPLEQAKQRLLAAVAPFLEEAAR